MAVALRNLLQIHHRSKRRRLCVASNRTQTARRETQNAAVEICSSAGANRPNLFRAPARQAAGAGREPALLVQRRERIEAEARRPVRVDHKSHLGDRSSDLKRLPTASCRQCQSSALACGGLLPALVFGSLVILRR